MEGIMMRSGERLSVAVRTPDGRIEVLEKEAKGVIPWKGIRCIPVLRGVGAFLDSLFMGTSALMWSAEVSSDEEEEKRELTEEEKKKEERSWKYLMTFTMILSVAFSVGLFMLLPYLLASLLRRVGAGEEAVAVAEAVLRILIFLAYMLLISRMKDIQTVFAYHGAEHKCINCVEAGLPLTVENVMKSSRQHKRCGTSFLLFVVLISVIFFLIIGAMGITSPLARFGLRLLFVPVIAGVSYEVLRLAGSSDHPLVNLLSKPGLLLQKLVTREPDERMAEVAITAVEAVFDWKAWQEKEFAPGGEEQP